MDMVNTIINGISLYAPQWYEIGDGLWCFYIGLLNLFQFLWLLNKFLVTYDADGEYNDK